MLAATRARENGGSPAGARQRDRRSRRRFPAGDVLYKDAFAMMPFGNNSRDDADRRTAEGRARAAICDPDPAGPDEAGRARPVRRLHLRGRHVEAEGSRVSGMRLNGKPVPRPAAIGSPLNNYLASGGDSFTAFTQGTDVVDRESSISTRCVAWIAPGRTPPQAGPCPLRCPSGTAARRSCAACGECRPSPSRCSRSQRLDADPAGAG